MADSSGQAIFTTPENNNFYARRKYKELNPHTHEIRLLRVHPARLTANELESVFPEWVKGDTDAADLVRSDSINERHEDFICCELLEPLPLESVTHKYAALSYCAGSASTTKRIMIDGFWFNAFANLEHALDGFMHCYDRFSTSRSSSLIRKENGLDRFVPVYDPDSTSGNLIWTDQACINQIGYSEKSHQVGFMRDIYQHAERTYVVLSTPDSPSQRVQRGVEAVQVTSQYLNDWIQELSDWRGYYEYWTKKCSNFFIQLVYEEPDHPICEALPQLVEFLHLVADAKWWTRAWVLQEFIASSRVYFVYGRHCVSLQDIQPLLLFQYWNTIHPETWWQYKPQSMSAQTNPVGKSVKVLRDSVNRPLPARTSYILPHTFCRRKSHPKRFGSDEGFLSMMTMNAWGGFQATDQRDMIYAFIGLTHIFSEMIPDYSPSNTIAKVFIEATEMALESFRYIGGKGLVLLTRAASTRWCNKLVSELPSWCPDWTAKEPRRHDDRPAYFFPLSEPYYFLSDPQRSKWKILRVQAVFLTNVGDKDDQGIFRNSLRLHFGKSSCVAAGDELWALNGGVSIHVLRKREGHNGEYILVGLALPYPSKAKHIGGRMPVELDDYEIAMETARTKGVKWIEIF